MTAAASVPDESARLAELQRFGVLDTAPEPAYDDLVLIAAQVCATPIALISLVDSTRQWFKARLGLDISGTPRTEAFCEHALDGDGLFVVGDAERDPRFTAIPLVLAMGIRFYAGAPLRSRSGHTLGTLCVMDYRPRELLEEQATALQRLASQVMQLLALRAQNALVAQQRAELIRRMERHEQLLSIIAHDLRAPFVSQAGVCDLIEAAVELGTLQKLPRHLHTLRATATSGIQLVDNLLRWSLREANGLQPVAERVDLVALLREAWQVFEPAALHKTLRLILRVPSEAVCVVGERNALRSVLMNLLGNAVKFALPGQAIEVAVHDVPEAVGLNVRDYGIGMSEAVLRAVLSEDWVPSQPGTAGERGSGLGLRLSRDLVARAGGQMQIASQPGQGTEVRLLLPRGS